MKRIIKKLVKREWFKDVESIVNIFATTVLITLFLLVVVAIFEKNNIHVPGSREMWIGLIGSLLGGAYTLLGVKMTLIYQTKSDNEKKRLENLPVLKFAVNAKNLSKYKGHNIVTIFNQEICTSAFPKEENKLYPVISIELANDKIAFDVIIESCMLEAHGKEAIRTKAFAPVEHRLVVGEKIQYMFWIKDYDQYEPGNVQGAFRITYADIFQNQYCQDIIFTYDERVHDKNDILEFSKIEVPRLLSEAPTLPDLLKKQTEM